MLNNLATLPRFVLSNKMTLDAENRILRQIAVQEAINLIRRSSMKRIRIRKLLLVGLWVGVVLVAFSSVVSGAAVLSLLAGLMLYLGYRLLTEWRTVSSYERILVAFALVVSMIATGFGTSVIIDDVRYLTRRTEERQSELRADPRFDEVTVKYTGSRTSPKLKVGGRVESEEDHAELESIANDNFWAFKCDVEWEVVIDPHQS